MRYSGIRAKLIIGILLAVLGTGRVFAQQSVTSPYSRYAVGELSGTSLAPYAGMGNTYVSLADSCLLNIGNPASYAFLMRHRPAFDIGISGQFVQANSATGTSTSNAVALRNIALGIPIGKRWGSSFGIIPFSSVGYQMKSSETDPLRGTVTSEFLGNGGINRLFIGNSMLLIKRPDTRLSLGFNASYLFGNINRERKTIYPAGGGTLNGKVKHNTIVSDFVFDAGLLYKGKVADHTWFSAGATFGLPSKVNARQEMLAYTYSSIYTEELVDTVQYVDSLRGHLSLPQRIGFGVSVEINKPIRSGSASRRLVIAAQYETEDWSSYSEVFGGVRTSDNLRNSRSFSAGVQYTPYSTVMIGVPGVKFWQTINYRAGLVYQDTYLQLNNTQLTRYGVTAGLGIPLMQSASLSSLNIGVEWGRRGTIDNNLVRENYFQFYLGFTICPHRMDGWFYKRKYD